MYIVTIPSWFSEQLYNLHPLFLLSFSYRSKGGTLPVCIYLGPYHVPRNTTREWSWKETLSSCLQVIHVYFSYIELLDLNPILQLNRLLIMGWFPNSFRRIFSITHVHQDFLLVPNAPPFHPSRKVCFPVCTCFHSVSYHLCVSTSVKQKDPVFFVPLLLFRPLCSPLVFTSGEWPERHDDLTRSGRTGSRSLPWWGRDTCVIHVCESRGLGRSDNDTLSV